MFVGTFEAEFNQFTVDVEAAVNQFKASGVEKLLIDVTNNLGSYEIMMKCQTI
jgi:6,7-dimethyl-8-ribityllumazine synthase